MDESDNERRTPGIGLAVERYASLNVLRAMVQALPLVGGLLDALITDGHARITSERTKYLLAGLSLDVERLGAGKLDASSLDCEEFHDIFVSAVAASARTRDRAKIRLNSRILAGAINDPGDGAGTCLDILSELDGSDVVVLRALLDQQREPIREANRLLAIKGRGWDALAERIAPVPATDLQYRLQRLARAGCVREVVGTFLGYTGGVYCVTDEARRVDAWVNSHGGFPSDAEVAAAQERADR